MSRDASIEIVWADGEYRFRLPLGQLRELQEKLNAGPFEVYRRLVGGTWRVDDVRETLRLGLIGGGMQPSAAHKLVQRYVDDRPLMESVQPAQAVLMAALTGPPEEAAPGKPEPAEAATETVTTGSPSPGSMAPQPS